MKIARKVSNDILLEFDNISVFQNVNLNFFVILNYGCFWILVILAKVSGEGGGVVLICRIGSND